MTKKPTQHMIPFPALKGTREALKEHARRITQNATLPVSVDHETIDALDENRATELLAILDSGLLGDLEDFEAVEHLMPRAIATITTFNAKKGEIQLTA